MRMCFMVVGMCLLANIALASDQTGATTFKNTIVPAAKTEADNEKTAVLATRTDAVNKRDALADAHSKYQVSDAARSKTAEDANWDAAQEHLTQGDIKVAQGDTAYATAGTYKTAGDTAFGNSNWTEALDNYILATQHYRDSYTPLSIVSAKDRYEFAGVKFDLGLQDYNSMAESGGIFHTDMEYWYGQMEIWRGQIFMVIDAPTVAKADADTKRAAAVSAMSNYFTANGNDFIYQAAVAELAEADVWYGVGDTNVTAATGDKTAATSLRTAGLNHTLFYNLNPTHHESIVDAMDSFFAAEAKYHSACTKYELAESKYLQAANQYDAIATGLGGGMGGM